MKKNKFQFFLLKQNKGGLTIDFIFAFTLIMGLSAILLSLSLTLTVASITQYATFVGARSLLSGHHTSDEQIANAAAQYNRVISHPDLSTLYQGDWFSLTDPAYMLKPGDLKQYKADFPDVDVPVNDPDLFIGFAVTFIARMLDFQIPFYGSTSDFGGDGSGFTTVIATFLSKEPSAQQCRDFSMDRWKAIRKLNVEGGGADYSSYTSEDSNFVWFINDNGC
ncbi:MAG: hypothetical protein KDD40_06285 [Bdellovibrionales bacterium]|nr:hypothetical protein [Bdellovibrionales bacterium]